MDQVFKALADPTRRRLLDGLSARNGQTLTELCKYANITRPAVAKHLAILESAGLVMFVWHGRYKLHYLNPVPIFEIEERWIKQYERHKLAAIHSLNNKEKKYE